MARPAKRTKIVATIGPASDSEEMLRRLIEAGLDGVRLTLSHSSAEQAKPLVARIIKVADELGVFVGILGDLRGPRIRVGEMENGAIQLEPGHKIILTPNPVIGTPEKIAVSFRGLANDVAHGTIILLDDGNIELQVVDRLAGGEVLLGTVPGGGFKSNKSAHLKNSVIFLPSFP